MSEIKRAALIPFSTVKVEERKGKEAGKTVRISLVLPESNEDTCPEYNYKEELAAAKRKEKFKHIAKPTTNGLDPFNEDDDDVRRIAQEMEAKYGCSGPKKKRKGRRDDYADIGMGYDESDSFIDNTDGYDEMIPQNVTTLHGGFYINCGALEFKTDEEASSEVSSSLPDEDTFESTTSRKRALQTSNESEGENETEKNTAQAEKKPKLQNDTNGVPKLMKKKYHLDLDKLKQLKKKRNEENKKKAATVKELLKEKREDDDVVVGGAVAAFDNNKPVEKVDNKEEPSDSMKENKKPMCLANISDIIEQVVRGVDDDLKGDCKSGGPPEKPSVIVASDGDNSRGTDEARKAELLEIVKLPENLPNDIVEIIDKIKDYASKNTEGKVKFFSGPVSEILLRLERKCKCLGKQSRMKIYEHLAPFVKCRKETLIRRAKNLVLEDEQKKLPDLVNKLKSQIDVVMPPLLESYERESQRIMQKKFSKESVTSEENKQLRMPKRKFAWTEEIKKLLKEIVSLRKRCFILEGKNKDNLEDLLTAYLKSDIQILWPEGWMSMTALQKVCNNITTPDAKRPNEGFPPSDNIKKPPPSAVSCIEIKKPVVKGAGTSASELAAQKELQKLNANSNLSITPVVTATASVTKLVNTNTNTNVNVNVDSSIKPRSISVSKSDITINKIENVDSVSKINKALPDIIKTSNALTITQTVTSIKTTCDRMERIDFIKPNIESEVIVLDDTLNKTISPTLEPPSTTSAIQQNKHDIINKSSKHEPSKIRSEVVPPASKLQQDIGSKMKSENLQHIKQPHDININKLRMGADSIQTYNKHDNINKPLHMKQPQQPEATTSKTSVPPVKQHEVLRSDNNHCQIIDLTEQLPQELKKSLNAKPKSKYYEADLKVIKNKPSTSELIKAQPSDKEELTGSSALTHLIAESLNENLAQNLTKTLSKVTSESNPSPKNYGGYTSTNLEYPKIKTPNEGDDIQKVMEDLKALQKLSSPVKISESPTSSPVSVIAFNKNYSPKPLHSSTPHSQPPSSHTYRNEFTKADFSSGFQEAFQRQLLNDFAIMQNSVNHSTPTSSKSHYNSVDKYPHTSAAYLNDKYYQTSNNNYAQANSSKIKNLPPQQSGSYNILDDMLANFLTEYGYPKPANHIPKPSQK